MPFSHEIQMFVNEENARRHNRATDESDAHAAEQSENAAEADRIQKTVDIGHEVAQSAADHGLPKTMKLIERPFESKRLGSHVPLWRKRIDVPKIAQDGMYERPAAGEDPKLVKENIIQRGQLGKNTVDEGWGILFSFAHRTRKIGVMLTVDGRLGVFDVPGNLERDNLVPPHTPGHVPTDHNPEVVTINSSVYAGHDDRSEEGIFYLDQAGHELPEFVEKIMYYDRDGTSQNGLDAINSALIDFIVDNNLS
jgi:hypothetical protein